MAFPAFIGPKITCLTLQPPRHGVPKDCQNNDHGLGCTLTMKRYLFLCTTLILGLLLNACTSYEAMAIMYGPMPV